VEDWSQSVVMAVVENLPDAVRNSALSEDAFAKLLKSYLMN